MKRKIGNTLWFMLTFSLVSLAVMVTSIRVILPSLNNNIELFQDWSSEKLGKDIQIGHVKVSWLDNKPALRFQEVLIKDPESKTNLLEVGDVFLIFRPIKSIFQLEPTFGTITLTGLHLSVTQSPDSNQWAIRGLDSVLEAPPSQSPQDQKGIQDLLAWLTTQNSVRIKSSSIEWRKSERDILPLYIEELTLQNASNEHELMGKFLLALDTPATLSFTSSLTGDLFKPETLDGQWYANLSHAKLKEWQTFIAPLPKDLNALVDIHSWGKINSIQDIKTDWEITAENLNWKKNKAAKGIHFDLLEWKTNLQLNQDVLKTTSQIRAQKHSSKPTVESLIQTQTNLKEKPHHKAFISELNLEYLQPLAEILSTKIQLPDALQQVQTSGHLKDISLVYLEDEQIKVASTLSDVSLYQVEEGAPKLGFSGLSGDFFTDLSQARLSLNSDNMTVSLPEVFPNAINTGRIDGDVTFDKTTQEDWTLSSKKLHLHPNDQAFSLSFQYEKSAKIPPHLSYFASFDDLNETIFENYIPENIMGADLPSWLRRAIRQLSLTEGRSLFHGPVEGFPFHLGNGVFQTAAKIDSLTLDYSEKWPQISQGKGFLTFNDASLDIQLDEAVIAGMQIDACRGYIENLEQDSLLVITGDVSGAGKNLTHFLHNSPLKSTFGETEDDFSLSGPTQVSLTLKQPLGSSTRVFDLDGRLKLSNNQLELIDRNWLFSNMKGEVTFKQNAVSAENLSATFFESPVAIQLGSERQDDQSLEIKAKIDGQVSITSLEKKYQHPLLSKLSGQTDYTAVIKLRDNHQGSVNTKITLDTELEGIEVKLPAPLGKKAEQKKSLRTYLNVFPAKKTAETDIQYGNAAKARLLFATEPSTQLKSLVLSMGTAPIQGQPKEGFFLRGQVPELDIDAWEPIVKELLKQSEGDKGLAANELSLQVQTFDFLGNEFNNLKLEAMQKTKAWDLYIDSPNLSGIVEIPKEASSLKLNLKKLKLNSNNHLNKQETLKPSDIPKMTVNVEELFFDDKPLGQLSFSYHATSPNLVNINDLLLKGKASELNAKLQWIVNGNSEQSLIQFTFDADDVQKAVKDWGMDTGMKETKAKLTSELQWPGSPADFNFSGVEGSVNLDLKGGRLVEVDPGATRLFGLWSLQTLTRRLTLDFSDLYKKGLSFDSIKGKFKLLKGDAYTCDTRLVSPSTRVDIQGRTGLVKKDFEQIANVALSITDPVPYIVAVFNPIAGALTWLGSKALEKTIDKMTGVRYLITGSWDEPEVQPLGPILKEAVEALPGIDSGESDHAKSAKRIESFEAFCLP